VDATIPRQPLAVPASLLRVRTDAQLLSLFRAGHDEAFRVLHERYEARLLGYAKQMLRRDADAEDAVQDVFVRAYDALRADGREIAVRAWLYRVAHNRCIDALRRRREEPATADENEAGPSDPVTETESREAFRLLIDDLRALPDQQRSALVIRELEGLSYEELAVALDTTVPAVKSLLVRARVGLAEAAEARATDCTAVRGQIRAAVDSGKGGKPSRLLREHLRQCQECTDFRRSLRARRRPSRAAALFGT
jgi:RNA polymerase sigma factor (sigma-70 family)